MKIFETKLVHFGSISFCIKKTLFHHLICSQSPPVFLLFAPFGEDPIPLFEDLE